MSNNANATTTTPAASNINAQLAALHRFAFLRLKSWGRIKDVVMGVEPDANDPTTTHVVAYVINKLSGLYSVRRVTMPADHGVRRVRVLFMIVRLSV